MSEVSLGDLRIINDFSDVWDTYQGAGKNSQTGVEVELAFFDPDTPDLSPMTPSQNAALKDITNNELGGDYVRNEPTSEMLEIGSIPAPASELQSIMDDTNKKISALTQQAEKLGLKRSYFQELPHQTAPQLLKNLMDVDRYKAFFGPPRDDMKDVAAYFSVCKSNQVSVSYTNPDHMLENIRRLYFLAPFLFLITDNSTAFNEGQPFAGHSGMHHRMSLGDRGGVPGYAFSAKDGEDYLRAHIHHVMNNKLFVYYNEEGHFVRVPSGQWVTFNDLREKGLNTATNYFFSESILWPDVKIAALKNEEGQVINHRYEARMFGVGLHQHQTALLIVSALSYDSDFSDKVDHLLKNFGLDKNNLHTAQIHLTTAYEAAKTHNNRFLEIPYGEGQLSDFARKFLELLEKSSFGSRFEKELAPLSSICCTGYTDGKVNRILFNTLDKIANLQRNYDPEIFENPNISAYTLFQKELHQSESLKSASCA